MYNIDNDIIPSFLPVLEEVQLRPWFSRKTLDDGLALIRAGRIGDFLVIRDSFGACIDRQATVTLQIEKSTKLSQGFVIRSNYCDHCGFAAQRERCSHMAALAILSLVVPAGQQHARPVSLVFPTSHWAQLGEFLFDWLSRGKYSARCNRKKNVYRWRIEAADGKVSVDVPSSWQSLAEQLFPQNLQDSEKRIDNEHVTSLLGELKMLNMTPGERQLEMAGSVGLAWKRDNSFWVWLAKMLFICHGSGVPELQRDSGTGGLRLRLGEEGTAGALLLELPRERCWPLLKSLPFADRQLQILPAARECYRVFFNSENLLEVRPSLRLEDGRLLDRAELSKNRFSGAWYLPGEGFLPASRLPAEGELHNPRRVKSTLSLLAFLESEESKDQPFVVALNDLPTFLDQNRHALSFADHAVDSALLELKIGDYPDKMIIDSFKEQGAWCYLSCRFLLGETIITLPDIRNAREKDLSCLPGRQWLRINDTLLTWFYELLSERYDVTGEGFMQLSYLELLRLTALIPEVEVTIENQALKKHLTDMLDVEHWTDGSLLATIPAHLRPYQSNGLAWLMRLTRFGIGGLLADDMGLGKTHQGLALLHLLFENNRNGCALVVCPASVVLHWVEKINTYYPTLNYTVYYGGQRDLLKAREHNVIITTYGVVRQDITLLQSSTFELVLLDEIQQAKNHTTAIHQAVVALNSSVKIGLTGTPVENSLEDLRSLFAICIPGLLGGERQFFRQFVQPITENGNSEVRERLTRLIYPFVLRRTRRQVLRELPEVIEDDRLCSLSDEQRQLYHEVLATRANELNGLVDEMVPVPDMHILATITRLKQVCCHPCLLLGGDTNAHNCGKWELFVELCEELLAAEMKFVVFSQYIGMLDLIEEYFRKQGIRFAGLRGDMPAAKRQKMIEKFNTDPTCQVFCASLLAGGVGIDLTGAQAVIHYDRWWNPAREEQATARVHRMGQKEVVQVFRLITAGTIEEKIHQLLQQKRQLAESLIHEDEAGIIKQMDRAELAELFRA